MPFGNIFWSIQRLPQAAAATGYQTPRCFGANYHRQRAGSAGFMPMSAVELMELGNDANTPVQKNFLENEK
ncbi:hypothetical protein [Diaphorobacter limosus]|uniref:Uncharacterized protein n=1 Tax=Diaphorobacter limosus TaxID=3036128 RepID=A0ABZ0J5K3_9BURK|nr:hypothetical protein [Diaphorobacter sp. Y-1]WOO33525.1 hypothetical protein P4826_05450 [Diaphorobacter sp. Y-1]